MASLKSQAIKQEIQREVYKDRQRISGCVGPVWTAGGCGEADDRSGLYGVGMVAQFCDYITYHDLYTLSECIVWNVNYILLTVLLL